LKAIVIYDSVFGNTATVARAIGEALEAAGATVRVVAVTDARPEDVDGADLLVAGSPTRGFMPTPAMREFVGRLGHDRCRGLTAAAFDTRLDLETVHPAPLRWVMDVGGYAASRLQAELVEMGCSKPSEPAGFLVMGAEGPLKDGELARAADWARGLLSASGSH
jgi:flavodoxin